MPDMSKKHNTGKYDKQPVTGNFNIPGGTDAPDSAFDKPYNIFRDSPKTEKSSEY